MQPGVEFGENVIFDYDRESQRTLVCFAKTTQSRLRGTFHRLPEPVALAEMVEDHFAILKVGPQLTFAFREAIFALTAIERESLGRQQGSSALASSRSP